MSATKAVGLATGLIALVGAMFAVDSRYLHADAADQIEQRREYGDLTTQLTLHRNRLSYLASKSVLTADESEEVQYLREQVRTILARLSALQK